MTDWWYNEQAYQLAYWAIDEPNRIKASKIMRIAERIERETLSMHKHRALRGQLLPPPPLPPLRGA